MKLWYHQDRLGSTDFLTDNISGKVTSYVTYDSWGAPTMKAILKLGVRELDLVTEYTGHPYDPVLSIYYARARMYDAADRRFMAADLFSGWIVTPSVLVRYKYVLNNPLRNIDPTGLFALSIGNRGELVTMLQEYLVILGYLNMNPDEGHTYGYFGDRTAEAVALFGIDNNKTPLAIVDTRVFLLIANAAINRKYSLETLSVRYGKYSKQFLDNLEMAKAEYDAIVAKMRSNYVNAGPMRGQAYYKPFDPCFWAQKPNRFMNFDRARIEYHNMRELRNRYGDLIEIWARELGCSPGALAGVMYAESDLKGFNNGQVMIRFEVHIFHKYAEDHKFEYVGNDYVSAHFKHSAAQGRQSLNHQYRANLSSIWNYVHTEGANSYISEREAFALACSINRPAALLSTSYGLGQVMGFNFSAVGYKNPEEMVALMSSGQTAQINAMCSFIASKQTAKEALQRSEWDTFVQDYNGAEKGSKKNDEYVQKIINGKHAYDTNSSSIKP